MGEGDVDVTGAGNTSGLSRPEQEGDIFLKYMKTSTDLSRRREKGPHSWYVNCSNVV